MFMNGLGVENWIVPGLPRFKIAIAIDHPQQSEERW